MSQQFNPFPPAALVLCGGKSRRMGSDKAWLAWNGEPLLVHLTRHLRQFIPQVHVLAAADQTLPQLDASVQVHRDLIHEAGPLVALTRGLELLEDCTSVWVSSVDSPTPQAPLIQALTAGLSEVNPRSESGYQAAAVKQEAFAHPLTAVYRPAVHRRLKELQERGERRLQNALSTLDVRWMDLAEAALYDPDLSTLRNLNTPSDYLQARPFQTEADSGQ